MTATLRIVPVELFAARRPQRMVERSTMVLRRAPMIFVSGFFELLFYLLSIRIGLAELIGDVEYNGRLVPYDEFVARVRGLLDVSFGIVGRGAIEHELKKPPFLFRAIQAPQ